MIVQRDGDRYEVRSLGDDWRFWEDQFTGTWEPETKAVIDALVEGGTYVDLGAWVGPTVLWGAKRARHVIAVEPDPVAFRHLEYTVAANHLDHVWIARLAVGDPGPGFIRTAGSFGDSQSSTIRGANGKPVDMVTVETVVGEAQDVQLIKMDIEGAEGDVIPREISFIRELGAPLLLSLHPHAWLTDPTPYLEPFRKEQVAQWEWLYYP